MMPMRTSPNSVTFHEEMHPFVQPKIDVVDLDDAQPPQPETRPGVPCDHQGGLDDGAGVVAPGDGRVEGLKNGRNRS